MFNINTWRTIKMVNNKHYDGTLVATGGDMSQGTMAPIGGDEPQGTMVPLAQVGSEANNPNKMNFIIQFYNGTDYERSVQEVEALAPDLLAIKGEKCDNYYPFTSTVETYQKLFWGVSNYDPGKQCWEEVISPKIPNTLEDTVKKVIGSYPISI
jgi:hypothetical protein